MSLFHQLHSDLSLLEPKVSLSFKQDIVNLTASLKKTNVSQPKIPPISLLPHILENLSSTDPSLKEFAMRQLKRRVEEKEVDLSDLNLPNE
jgi:hypothetical protein